MKLKIFSAIIIFILTIYVLSNFVLAISTDTVSIAAPYAILVDANSGTILYEKNAYERTSIASTTKIMTAILTIENCDLNETVTASFDAVISVPYDYTNAAIQVDEQLTVNDLLNVLLVYSANDAANVLAEHVGGSISSFASMMNTKASEIGCTNTNFKNPSGMDAPDHYSSAHDLFLIAQYAMKNDTFRSIVCKTNCSLPITNKYDKDDRIFNTSNFLINPNKKYYYEFANGIKTGFTDDAQDCLVASAKKDGLELIAVVLGVDINTSPSHEKFIDCKKLFEFGFENYTTKEIVLQDSVCKQIEVLNATKETRNLNLLYANSINALSENNGNIVANDLQITLKNNISAPISKGEVLGTVTYTFNGINYSTDLIAENDVIESKELNLFFKIILIIFAFLIIYKLLNGKKKKKNHRRKK